MRLSRRKKWIGGILLLILVGILSLFLLRGYVLRCVVGKISNRFQSTYHASFVVKEVAFIGVQDFYLKGISLQGNGVDTLLTSDSIYIKIKIWPLLTGSIRVERIFVTHPVICMNYEEGRNNFSFLLKKQKQQTSSSPSFTSSSYQKKINHLFTLFFNVFPNEACIENLFIQFKNQDYRASVATDHWMIKNGRASIQLKVKENKEEAIWNIKTVFNQPDSLVYASIYRMDSKKPVKIPILSSIWPAGLGWDTMEVQIRSKNYQRGLLQLQGIGSVKELMVYHPKLASHEINIHQSQLNFNLLIGSNFIELDSSSSVIFNKINYHPYLKYQTHNPKQIIAKILPFEFKASDFFASLPAGMFQSIEGMKVDGFMKYSLHVDLNFENPEEMIFKSALEKKTLSIREFGNLDFRKINEDFLYTIYENDTLTGSFIVGTQNPNFTSLDNISPYLKNAVLTAEDGGFYEHKGFYEEAFKRSIVTNLQKGRFARGGSTISMQLVKNVFLTKKKTLSRKLEEIMIVWLIENMRLVSKDRMFEVYLNVIEWGPGIYGIKQASQFYFQKSPSELSLPESIYLSFIIPKPKKFKTVFTSEGFLKPYYSNYFNLLLHLMLTKQQISETDTVGIHSLIQLKGKAQYTLFPSTDTTKTFIDSVSLLDEMM